jgi:peptidoglycan/LPS O-acetylase OafA/YrhL
LSQGIALLAVIVSVACAWLFWRAIEVPALAWSRRIGARVAVA